MRAAAVVLGCLFLAGAATASSALDVTVLPKPSFPPPASNVSSSGVGLVLVSSRYRSPIAPTQPAAERPEWAPRAFRSHELVVTIRQGPRVFLVYGDGFSGRYLVGASARTRALEYAYDFRNFLSPPGGGELERVVWAREADGVLYVETAHLTYSSASHGRTAYLSAIDLDTRKTLWRSRALVANARTFVLAGDRIVSGYGFTAEPDFLYLLDRGTGRALERLKVPSAPERITLRGNLLRVRTYDRSLVARIAAS